MDTIPNHSISQAVYETSSNELKDFLQHFHFSKLLNNAGIRKNGRYSSLSIVYALIILPFLKLNLYRLITDTSRIFEIPKDNIYNFMKNPYNGWRKLFTSLSTKIYFEFKELGLSKKEANRSQKAVITLRRKLRIGVIDDTSIPKNKQRNPEVIGNKQYDHTTGKYYRGFACVTLLSTDGVSSHPIDLGLTATSNTDNIETHNEKQYHKNTNGAIRREEVRKTKLDIAFEMLVRSYENKIDFDYVTYDSWFGIPSFIHKCSKYYKIVCNIKINTYQYLYDNKLMSVENILKEEKKKNNRLKTFSCYVYLLYKENNKLMYQECKLVFTEKRKEKNNKKRKEKEKKKESKYMAILSTDTTLTDKEIKAIYSRRWDIEVFFRTSKQFLELGKGSQSNNFDALIASLTICFIRYCFISYTERMRKHPQTLGIFCNNFSKKLDNIAIKNIVSKYLSKILDKDNINSDILDILKDMASYFQCNKIKQNIISKIKEINNKNTRTVPICRCASCSTGQERLLPPFGLIAAPSGGLCPAINQPAV